MKALHGIETSQQLPERSEVFVSAIEGFAKDTHLKIYYGTVL